MKRGQNKPRGIEIILYYHLKRIWKAMVWTWQSRSELNLYVSWFPRYTSLPASLLFSPVIALEASVKKTLPG